MKKVLSSLLVVGSIAVVGCTKKVPYKYEFKEDVIEKNMIDTVDSADVVAQSQGVNSPKDYLYTASALEMSRQTVDGRPFSYGDSKRVQLVWDKDSLVVIEKDRDQRYVRSINDRVILNIPVEHLDFECSKDAYGECTTSETQKTDVNWKAKGKFKFKPEEAKQGSLEFLPILADNALGGNCYQEVSSKLLSYQVEKEALNFQVERTYRQNIDCMTDIENTLSETSIKAVYSYSLVKANSVISPNFKVVKYDTVDEDTFGFFSTTQKTRDVDNNLIENGKTTIMNHWNPERSTIDYYLSDEFGKPANAKLKELTFEAVRRLNLGLANSGAKFQIVLHEPSGKNPGDIRNSMIVLVEDPTESGLLGYGPQTEDPLTGEIISARTIMFLAGFQQGVQNSYEDLRRYLKQQNAASGAAGKSSASFSVVSIDLPNSQGEQKQMGKESPAQMKPVTMASMNLPKNLKNLEMEMKKSKLKNQDYTAATPVAYAKYLREAKNCALDSSMMSNSLSKYRPDLIKQIVARIGLKDGELRSWKELNSEERQFLVDTIVGEEWISVVLHEMGHNMGLRHNFNGSEDKANFYTPESDAEILNQFGVNYTIPYSTIMEYGDDLHSLSFLGKYDIAALKFGYARTVEVLDKEGRATFENIDKSGSSSLESYVKTIEAQGKKLKEYAYCTDESVGPNPGCRRFDEGTSYSEIADHLIETYKNYYSVRNFRNGRDNFSAWNDLSVLRYRYYNFLEMRNFIESVERIKHIYGLSEDHPAWEQYPFLKDLKEASLKSVRLMIEVLQTPDLQCLIAKKQDPSKIVAVNALSEFGDGARSIDCFTMDPSNIDDKYVIVGQVGKRMNSAKDPNSTNRYIDQIDVRGYWIDKYAATLALFKRSLNSPSFDDNLDNAWDITTVHDELKSTLVGLVTNNLVTTQQATLTNGATLPITYAFNYQGKGDVVQKPMNPGISKVFGLKDSRVPFTEMLLSGIAKSAELVPENYKSSLELKDFVGVTWASSINPLGNNTKEQPVLMDDLYVVAKKSNTIALELIFDYQLTDVLEKMIAGDSQEAAQKKIKALQNVFATKAAAVELTDLKSALPEVSDELLTEVLRLSSDRSGKAIAQKIEMYVNGALLSKSSIYGIIRAMPKQH